MIGQVDTNNDGLARAPYVPTVISGNSSYYNSIPLNAGESFLLYCTADNSVGNLYFVQRSLSSDSYAKVHTIASGLSSSAPIVFYKDSSNVYYKKTWGSQFDVIIPIKMSKFSPSRLSLLPDGATSLS